MSIVGSVSRHPQLDYDDHASCQCNVAEASNCFMIILQGTDASPSSSPSPLLDVKICWVRFVIRKLLAQKYRLASMGASRLPWLFKEKRAGH